MKSKLKTEPQKRTFARGLVPDLAGDVYWDELLVLEQLATAGSLSKAFPGSEKKFEAMRNRKGEKILRLQEGLGNLVRDHDDYSINETGKHIAGAVRLLLQTLKEVEAKTLDISIACGDSLHHSVVLPALATAIPEIKKRWPKVSVVQDFTFDVRDRSTQAIIEEIRDFKCDLALLLKKDIEASNLGDLAKYLTIGKYRYTIIGPKELLKEKGLKSSLDNLPFAMIKKHHRHNFEELLRGRIKIQARCENFTQVARLILTKKFVGLLPIYTCVFFENRPFVRYDPPALTTTETEVGLCWNPKNLTVRTAVNNAKSIFLRALIDAFNESVSKANAIPFA
jgi:DNA-binding transcriptional LysR family regulator